MRLKRLSSEPQRKPRSAMSATKEAFYIFASPTKTLEDSPSTVFCKVDGEPLAQTLCSLFTSAHADSNGIPTFHCKAGNLVSVEEQLLLNEAIDCLAIYDHPDPGVYDPSPSQHTLFLAQCATRARNFEELVRRANHPGSQAKLGDLPGISAAERRNSDFIILMSLAQAYYKILECTCSNQSQFAAMDLRLNHAYLWTVDIITNLLKNSEGLEDFPIPFEPIFSNLFPSSIQDVDWRDMVAPEAERFLSTVQQYVYSKRAYDPKEGTLESGFVKFFRAQVDEAIKMAVEYEERMRQHTDADRTRMHRHRQQTDRPTSNTATDVNTPIAKRDIVFISYSHKDKKHLNDLLPHLKPLERAGRISSWSDQQITPASKWFDEIKAALARTSVALMLVSSDFLASDFIDKHELGPLLKEAEVGGVKILWVLIRDCMYRETPLAQYQAVLPPDQPVAKMRTPERDTAWRKVCEKIQEAAIQA
jgi:TIR domain